MFSKNNLILLLVVMLTTYITTEFIFKQNENKYNSNFELSDIEKKEKVIIENLAKKIAKSSTVFLSNFALDELEKKINLDMENKKIKAIVIKDLFLEQNFLVAYRDEYNEINFTDTLPNRFQSFRYVKEKIIEEKSYTKTDLGELILYYDKKASFYKPNFNKNELIYLAGKKSLRICIDPNWMPLESLQNGQHVGITADYMNIISKQTNKRIELVPTLSWLQSLDKIKNKECDILPLAEKTKNRDEYLRFTKPYITTNVVIATKVGIPFIDNIEEIQDKKLAIVKGYSLYETLKSNYPNINLVSVSSIKDGLRQVETGQVFGYIDNTIVMNHTIQKDFLGTITISGKLKGNMQLSIATRKDDLILNNILEKIVLLLSEDVKNTILNKWIKINYNLNTDYTLVWQLILATIFIIIISLYWIKKLATLNKQLEVQRNKAHEASKAKAQFLANMSHEIRTPMNAILGINHLLLQSNLDKNQKESLEKIEKSANSLLRIINDILDFSKIEAGKLKFDKEKFKLRDVLNDSIDNVSLQLFEKGLDFSVNYDNRLYEVYEGDKLRVTQILTNLLSNAVKFTKEGKVELTIIQQDNDFVRFEVKDTGIGLSKKEQNKLFKSFSQADETTSKQYGGTGLGLAICNQLVNQMDGKIWVESIKDEGSTFIFEIKLPSSEQIVEEITKVSKNIIFENNWILLVEDNKINQQIITGLLKDTKINIDIAEDGNEAVELYNHRDAYKYDLILMDIQMPNLDGYDATKALRKLGITIPIIALSANALEEDIRKSRESGMDEHLQKPIDIERLTNVLEKYLQKEIKI